MSVKDVERLEQDLTTFRGLLKADRPFDRDDVLPLIVIGFGAQVALPLLSMQLLGSPRICLLSCLAPGIVMYARRYMTANRQKAERPNLWREFRVSAIVAMLLIPATIGWIWWSAQLGITRMQAGAPLMFCIGIAGIVTEIVDSQRRSYAVVGVGVTVLGICLPLIEPTQMPFAGSIVLAITAFGMAAWILAATRDDSATRNESELLSGENHG